MKPALGAGILACLCCGLAMLPAARAGDPATFTLSFDPCPAVLEVPVGANFQVEIYCVLTSAADPAGVGAQGWSISLVSEGVEIVEISTRGTVSALVTDDPPELREEGGFLMNELSASGANDCEGRRGAVGAVILSQVNLLTLPPVGQARIARLVVQGKAPAEVGGTLAASVFYVDGCSGKGWPVDNVITWQLASVQPVLVRCDFEVKAVRGMFRRGDANDDGKVDLSDPVTVLSVKFLGTGRLPCRDAADVNDDGGVDLSDAISLLAFLFLGSYSPAPPGAARCGPDPTGDSLPECESASCGFGIQPLPDVNGGCGS